jgi:hypothetical protein
MNDITLKDIFEAQRRIAPIALKTPLTFRAYRKGYLFKAGKPANYRIF